MKSLGLSPTEQEVVDMQNEVERNGKIFYPDFCKLCLRKFREFDEENFKQELFKVNSSINFALFLKTLKNSRVLSIILYFRTSVGLNHIQSDSGPRNTRYKKTHSD